MFFEQNVTSGKAIDISLLMRMNPDEASVNVMLYMIPEEGVERVYVCDINAFEKLLTWQNSGMQVDMETVDYQTYVNPDTEPCGTRPGFSEQEGLKKGLNGSISHGCLQKHFDLPDNVPLSLGAPAFFGDIAVKKYTVSGILRLLYGRHGSIFILYAESSGLYAESSGCVAGEKRRVT